MLKMASLTQLVLLLCVLGAHTQDFMNPTLNIVAELEKLKNIQEQMKNMEEALQKQNSLVTSLKSTVEELKRENEVKKVVFSVALRPASIESDGFGKIGPFSSDSTLRHTHVITNIGEAYSVETGVFTAPVKGVYFFTFTTYSWVKKANIGVTLYRNSEEILMIWELQDAGDNEDYATNSASLILEAGDIVYIRLPEGFQVAASITSNVHTFSGFLLHQL